MTRPYDPTSPRWDLQPEPLPVDLDALDEHADDDPACDDPDCTCHDLDDLLLAEPPWTTLAPNSEYL